MTLKSLDPRITRLKIEDSNIPATKEKLDQHETYQVFWQLKTGKPFEFVGIVHAPNAELALLFGKEQYSRRGMFCSGIWIVKSTLVYTTDYTDGTTSAYDLNIPVENQSNASADYEIFHLKKRGKAHVHAGTVTANSYEQAFQKAKDNFSATGVVFNIWIAPKSAMLTIEDPEIWTTLPEKKYRDATAWKAADKIKKFKEEQNLSNA